MKEDGTITTPSLISDSQLNLVIQELKAARKTQGKFTFIAAVMPWVISVASIFGATATTVYSLMLSDIQIKQSTANLTGVEIECIVQSAALDKNSEQYENQISINYKCLNNGSLSMPVSKRNLTVWIGRPAPIDGDSESFIALNIPGESGAIVWTKRIVGRDLGACIAAPKVEISEPFAWVYKSRSASVVYVVAEIIMDDGVTRTASKWAWLK
jgi:hypothetical protein